MRSLSCYFPKSLRQSIREDVHDADLDLSSEIWQLFVDIHFLICIDNLPRFLDFAYRNSFDFFILIFIETVHTFLSTNP